MRVNYFKSPKAQYAGRAPKRVTATIPMAILEKLTERSILEGRSLSNLISYMLERSLEEHERSLSNSDISPEARKHQLRTP